MDGVVFLYIPEGQKKSTEGCHLTVWTTPSEGFIGRYRFWIRQIGPHGREGSPSRGEDGYSIHLKPGLMKPWRGVCPDQTFSAPE